MTSPAHAPATLEGWYALHQIYAFDRAALRRHDAAQLSDLKAGARSAFEDVAAPVGGGWSAIVPLIGSHASLMLMHFRPSLDELGVVQGRLAAEPLLDTLTPVYSFLSVTEAGLYHITAELAREAAARGGRVGDEAYAAALAERSAAERSSAHVHRRLYPTLPSEMPYVCFYPMSKRRESGQNWYTLSLDERSSLMQAHGTTGRRYAGRVQQVITGAIGLDAWEWGVTLFGRDPLDFKRLVTDMRFDEVSAKYAEFGSFYVGRVASATEWLGTIG
ncbi:MAG TPA: hydrogen peroxide-dependent heme synthase [Gemmatimonadaceae bacterium]|nr:hydrogen peroxide-dependent heme synthase [Gemmatimonadaceae bacterium]